MNRGRITFFLEQSLELCALVVDVWVVHELFRALLLIVLHLLVNAE